MLIEIVFSSLILVGVFLICVAIESMFFIYIMLECDIMFIYFFFFQAEDGIRDC